MTNQERPVEEQMIDNATQTNVAVADVEQSLHSEQVDEPRAAEPAVDQGQLAEPQASETPSSETPATQSMPVMAADVAIPSEAEPAAMTAVTESSDPAVAVVAVEAEPAAMTAVTESTDSSVAVEAEPVAMAAVGENTDTITPEIVTTATDDAASSEESAEPTEAAEASFTPVAETDEGGRPRRVKDLESGMELEGRVTSIALYGIFVDVGVGRDGLVHISEMSDTRVESPSDVVKIGDTVKVRVKNVEPDGRRISLTMRSKERQEPRPPRAAAGAQPQRKRPTLNREELEKLRVGDIVQGTVTGIATFGVFVDIGVGKDGLVHISELSEGRVDKAEDAVEVGQSYTFKLLEIDAEGTRISLSLRRAQRDQRMQELNQGQIIEGTVSGIAPFGAFVDIGVGRDGLVHISELSDARVGKVEDIVKVGDKVQARVLGVDPQSKRISLSLRLEDKPRELPVRDEREPREPSARETRDYSRPEPREDRGRRDDRDRGNRQSRAARQEEPTIISTGSDDDDLSGNATLEDLLSKYGNGNKRDRKRRRDEEDDEDRATRRQRDAVRRTLQSDDE
jgi:predicted RNA-binding protein with RPS1 domain